MTIKQYKVIITLTAYREINQIYEYIAEELYAEDVAKSLLKRIEEAVQRLKYTPRIHTIIEKIDELKRDYRKIVIKNYRILYTIDEENKAVFISHIYYSGRNYMDR